MQNWFIQSPFFCINEPSPQRIQETRTIFSRKSAGLRVDRFPAWLQKSFHRSWVCSTLFTTLKFSFFLGLRCKAHLTIRRTLLVWLHGTEQCCHRKPLLLRLMIKIVISNICWRGLKQCVGVVWNVVCTSLVWLQATDLWLHREAAQPYVRG